MDNDLALVLGVVIFAFAIPAVISAFTDGRSPRVATLCFMIGGSFIAYAVSHNPGGYGFSDVPDAFARVVGRYTN
ncbi:hypothetical protein [Frigidibacter sp. ROC022]|uniref:hypothetical protein n=1 Tax=Frigidibacter sp. ROC022 TaxID=2971796 RepID=UPI00215A18C0|nr:hypothetical protein [Frigidibacter sp. ROC022]MCR8724282.1 hypothetical protein [Frigidibacter sp. ROC022]